MDRFGFTCILAHSLSDSCEIGALLMMTPVFMPTGYTALDALEHSFRTVIVDDACRGVNAANIEKLKHKFVEQHGVIVKSNQARCLL